MNPRRVHELMRRHFPPVDPVAHEWINVADREGPRAELIETLLKTHIAATEVIIEVHRKLGDVLPRDEATTYICEHIGKGQIRVSDREFTSFVVVAGNGVATGWANRGPGAPDRGDDSRKSG